MTKEEADKVQRERFRTPIHERDVKNRTEITCPQCLAGTCPTQKGK